MTGDEYITVLEQRRDAYLAERPGQPSWLTPLLEWFIRPGDEQMVTLPSRDEYTSVVKDKPRRVAVYRTADSLRAERARYQRQLDTLTGNGGDTAAVNLSPTARSRAARNAGRRRMAALDRDIAKAANLINRIAALDARIARAEHRERTQA